MVLIMISKNNGCITGAWQNIVNVPIKKVKKFCMSHLGWTTLNEKGLCSQCGSAMLEDEDMT